MWMTGEWSHADDHSLHLLAAVVAEFHDTTAQTTIAFWALPIGDHQDTNGEQRHHATDQPPTGLDAQEIIALQADEKKHSNRDRECEDQQDLADASHLINSSPYALPAGLKLAVSLRLLLAGKLYVFFLETIFLPSVQLLKVQPGRAKAVSFTVSPFAYLPNPAA